MEIYIKQLFEEIYVKQLKDLGLVEITTPRQLKNKTRMFLETSTGDKFGIFEKTGYIRRHYTADGMFSKGCEYSYQLNPVITVTKKWGKKAQRILFPGEPERLFTLLIDKIRKRNSK